MKRFITGALSVILLTMIIVTGSSTFANLTDNETSSGNKALSWISAYHVATNEKDFETGENYFVDTSSSPGDVKLKQTEYLFACQGGGSNAVYRYNETTLAWESIAVVPGAGVGAGGGLSYPGSGNYVYCLKGGSSAEFYRYDISADSWAAMTPVTASVTTGGYMRATASYIYVFTGGAGNAFYRYDMGGNNWTALTSPGATGAGASMAWDFSNTLYATLGGGSTTFRSYSISGGTWTTVTTDPVPGAINGGGELSYANTGTAYIYATQGNATGGTNKGFYRYNPAAAAGSRWTAMTSTPAAVATGGSLRWDDDGFLFALQGGSTTFWRYNIALNTWAVTVAPVSYAVVAGGAYTSDRTRYNYAFTGGASNYFLRYDTSVVGGDTWSPLTSPGVTTGAGAYLKYCAAVTPLGNTLGDYIFAFQGGLSSAFWVYSVSAGTWAALASPGIGADDGASFEWTGGDYLYAIFGQTKGFKRYTISTNTWTTMKNTKSTINNGAGLAWDYGNNIYAINGSSNTFEKYSISANTWANLANLPGNVNSGGNIKYPSNVAGGNALYATRGAGSVSFYKYSVSANSWSVMDSVPSAVGVGGALANSSQGYFYCITGNSSTNHWKYNINYDVWAEILPNFPSTTGAGARMAGRIVGYVNSGYMTSDIIDNSGICEGGALVYDGTNIYGTAGDQSTSFRRYSISGNSWSLLQSLDYMTGWGTALCSDKIAYIYAFAGENSNYFARYSIASNTWTTLASAPGNVNAGGALVYIATATGYIYAYQGGSPAFWKYDVAANNWSVMAATSVSTDAGASLVYDGTDIYGTLGGSTVFRRYSIAGNTWTDMAPRADAVGAGGGLAYPSSGTYIYCLEGNDTSDLYRYDTVANSWAQMGSAPASVFQGGCLVADNSGYLYACRGRDTVSFWRYSISGDIWESLAETPAAAYLRLDALVWDRNLPAGTSIAYYIRSSNTVFSLTDASPAWTLLTVADMNSEFLQEYYPGSFPEGTCK